MSTARQVRLLIVDTQAIFRAGIRQICAEFPGVVVDGEAGRAADALLLCERLRPDLLLVDDALSGGLSLIAWVRERHPAVGVVLLADRIDVDSLRRALQLGIAGYLPRQIEAFDLVQALRSAASGLLTLHPDATAALARQEQREEEAFSKREQAVLALLMQGYSNDQIAARLQVGRSTVKFHLRNIYSKLAVRSRAEALALLFERRPALRGHGGEAPPELRWRHQLVLPG